MAKTVVVSKIRSEVARTQTALEELQSLADAMGVKLDVKSPKSVQSVLEQMDVARRIARDIRGAFRKVPIGRQLLDNPRTRTTASKKRPGILPLAAIKSAKDWKHYSGGTVSDRVLPARDQITGTIPSADSPSGDKGPVGATGLTNPSPDKEPPVGPPPTPAPEQAARSRLAETYANPNIDTKDPNFTTERSDTVAAFPERPTNESSSPLPYTDDELRTGQTVTGETVNYETLRPVQRRKAVQLGKVQADERDDLRAYADSIRTADTSDLETAADELRRQSQGASPEQRRMLMEQFVSDQLVKLDPNLSQAERDKQTNQIRNSAVGLAISAGDLNPDVFDGMSQPVVKRFVPDGDPNKVARLKEYMKGLSPSEFRDVSERLSPTFYTKDQAYALNGGDDSNDIMLPYPPQPDPEDRNGYERSIEWMKKNGVEPPQSVRNGQMTDTEYRMWAEAQFGTRKFSDTVKEYEGWDNYGENFKEGMTREEFRTVRNRVNHPKYGSKPPAVAGDPLVRLGDKSYPADLKVTQGSHVDELVSPFGVSLVGIVGDLRQPGNITQLQKEFKSRFNLDLPRQAKGWDASQWSSWMQGHKSQIDKVNEDRKGSGWDGETEDKRNKRAASEEAAWRRAGLDLKAYSRKRNQTDRAAIDRLRKQKGLPQISDAEFKSIALPENPSEWTKGQKDDAMFDLENYFLDGDNVPALVKAKQLRKAQDIRRDQIMGMEPEAGGRYFTDQDSSPLGSGKFSGGLSAKEFLLLKEWGGEKAYKAFPELMKKVPEGDKGTVLAAARSLINENDDEFLKQLGKLHVDTEKGMIPGKTTLEPDSAPYSWGLKIVKGKDVPGTSTSELLQTTLASYFVTRGTPTQQAVGQILQLPSGVDLESPEQAEVIQKSLADPTIRPVLRTVLEDVAESRAKEGDTDGAKRVNDMLGILPKKGADQDAVADGVADAVGGEREQPTGIMDQIFTGLKKMFSLDGLKDLWDRAMGGDVTAWLPLIMGGGSLLLTVKSLFEGDIGGMAIGAIGLGAAGALAGWGAGGEPEAPAMTEEDHKKEVSRAKAIADKAREEGVVPFDPKDAEAVKRLHQGFDKFGIIENKWGKNPKKILLDSLIQAARGEPARGGLDDEDGWLIPGAPFRKKVGTKYVNSFDQNTAQMLLGSLSRISLDLDRDDYRNEVYKLIRKFTPDPKEAEQNINKLKKYQMKQASLNFKKTFDVLGHATGYRPTDIGNGVRIPGGPLTGFLGSTALGGGVGYGVGSLVNLWSGDDEKKKKRQRARRWAMIGAIATGLPAAITSYGVAKSTVPQQGWVNGLVNVDPNYDRNQKVPANAISGHANEIEMPKAAEPPAIASNTTKKTPFTGTKLAFMDWMSSDVVQSVNQVASSNELTPFTKALSINMILDANQQQPGRMTFGQLAKAGIGAGLGTLGGMAMAKVLTSLLGLPAAGTRKVMQWGGGVAGGLTGAGFVR